MYWNFEFTFGRDSAGIVTGNTAGVANVEQPTEFHVTIRFPSVLLQPGEQLLTQLRTPYLS